MNRTLSRVIFFLLFLPFAAGAQTVWRGVVTDTAGVPLPFVSVLIDDRPGQGTRTDIDGRFRLEMPAGEMRGLTFRYVGYVPLRLDAAGLLRQAGRPLRVVLRAADYGLPEATVVAGENPADILIRKAIANRQRNNPEQRPAYRCLTYNKVVFEAVPKREAFEEMVEKQDSSAKKIKEARRRFDELEQSTRARHLFLLESVTERNFLFPNLVQEKVLLNRVSGFRQAGLVALANALQPFSFYGDFLTILDKNYVNPISPGSPAQYFFHIEDTLYTGPDTVFVISFHPRQGKIFDGLQGVLHLHSAGWAVQNVRARPANPNDNLDMKIEQAYRQWPDSAGQGQWFPEQLNFELEFRRYPSPATGIRIGGRSYITDLELHPDLGLRDFDPELPLRIEPEAHTRADSAWARWRNLAPLSPREEQTYRWVDSVGQTKGLDRVANAMDYLATGYVPIGNTGISLNLRQILRFNDFESVRLGAGFSNAQSRPLQAPRRFEVGAYGGYGFRDRAWKYGGYALWRVQRGWNTQVRLDARRDLTEPGALYELPPSAFFNRTLYARRMDHTDEAALGVGSRLGKALSGQLTLRRQRVGPGYEYRYEPPGREPADHFDFTEGTVLLRLAYGETARSFFGGALDRRHRVPVAELAYTYGREGAAATGPAYHRWALAVYQTTMVRRMGRLSWRAEAGRVTAGAPLARLFTLNQPGQAGFSFLAVSNTFQILPDTLFLADRFVNAYLSQEIGPVLYRTKWSAPVLSVLQNFAWGSLRFPERHRLGFRTADRPHFESGLQLDNLLKVNYINVAHLGVGAAVFYRWGGLESQNWRENTAVRLTLSLGF